MQENHQMVWHGHLGTKLTGTGGTTETNDVEVDFSAGTTINKAHIDMNGLYDYSTQEKRHHARTITKNEWYIDAEGRQDFDRGEVYVWAGGRYGRNTVKEIDRRTIISGGIGKYFRDTPELKFRAQIGIGNLHEVYLDGTPSDSDTTIALRYLLDTKLAEKVSLHHTLSYFPDVKQGSDYYLELTATIRTQISDAWAWDVSGRFDYNSKPANSAKKEYWKYSVGLTYKF